MTAPAARLLVSCVAENRPDWHTRVYNLALSCVTAPSAVPPRFVANFVGGIDRAAGRRIEDLGAEVRVVSRVDRRNPYLNKLRMLELGSGGDFDVLAALDCDTIVVRDLSPHLSLDSVGAKPADLDRLTPEQWRRLYDALGLDHPTGTFIATSSGQPIGPYFNSGVLLIPRAYCRPLLDAWTEMTDRILAIYREQPTIVPEQWRMYLDQYSLACALAATATPVRALPSELNYPTHVPVHPAARTGIDPVILHYHKDVTPSGFLTRSRTQELDPYLHAFNVQRSAALGITYRRLPGLPLKTRARRTLLRSRKVIRTAAASARDALPARAGI
jgi:hypothetical protein